MVIFFSQAAEEKEGSTEEEEGVSDELLGDALVVGAQV